MRDEEPHEQPIDAIDAAQTETVVAAEPDVYDSLTSVRGRFAIFLVLASVFLADAAIYKTKGFSGPAVFLLGACCILYLGVPRRRLNIVVAALTGMLLCICLRLASNGSGLQILTGIWLLCGLALSLRGRTPFVLEAIIFGFQTVPGGADFYHQLHDRVKQRVLDPLESRPRSRVVEIILPASAAIVFGGVFIMANPDVAGQFSTQFGRLIQAMSRLLTNFSLSQLLFWAAVAWITGGMLRPVKSTEGPEDSLVQLRAAESKTPLFAAYRNTMFTVISLFAIYLAFESRAFVSGLPPDGFTYSSYAHEGAAWLTTALVLATITLSLIFRGRTLNDPRIGRLKALAGVWSGLNLLLGIAAYNRMLIYINFNGMTRMRVIGMLGITAAIGGFALVIVKITRDGDFRWLIRRQLWILAAAVFLYAVVPVDSMIHRYNVQRIQSGSEAPIVQITEHPIDDEALPRLLPLCQNPDPRLRLGVCALLADRYQRLATAIREEQTDGWTAWQRSRHSSLAALEASRNTWDVFDSKTERSRAKNELRDYAFKTWW